MTSQKIIEMYKKERQRVETQIFNPILEVLNNKKYDDFYNYFLLININFEIMQSNAKVPIINFFTDANKFIKTVATNDVYAPFYKKVLKKIYEVYNFDVFKLVFGEQNYEPWAASFFKFILFSFYEENGLVNVKEAIADGSFQVNKYCNDKHLTVIIDTCFKVLYGYSYTQISTFEYWQQVTGINRSKYNLFLDIVNKNNPAVYLLNSFYFYNSNIVTEAYNFEPSHKYKVMTPSNRPKLTDPTFAKNWIIDYFSCLTLNSKLQTVLWKAIQALTFGSKVDNKTIAMRTISQININIQDVYKLTDSSINFFKNLKWQAVFDLKKPDSFLDFISQNPDSLHQAVSKRVAVYSALSSRRIKEVDQQISEEQKRSASTSDKSNE